MLVISALGRLKQQDCFEFWTTLGYIVNSRIAWAGCSVRPYLKSKIQKISGEISMTVDNLG